MLTKRFTSLALGSLVVVALSVACGDDSGDDNSATGGSAGRGGSSAGTSSHAGSSNTHAGTSGSSGSAGSTGTGGSGATALGGAGGEAPTESGGAPVGGAGGGESQAGQAGAAGSGSAAGGNGGASSGGEGGGETASCDSVREGLLGPVASASTGLVTVSSEQNGVVAVVIDGSAGGIAAAAGNPYIYVSLSGKSRVDVTDPQADSSTAWDLAFKRDNIRSNGGDSGPGQAQIAFLTAADFDATTAAAATGADFGQDTFIDANTCEPIVDAVGKALTTFDGWYDYDPATNGLTPADRVYLVRAANGSTLYKLKITGYYVNVSDGMGGTVKKSAVYSLKYQAL